MSCKARFSNPPLVAGVALSLCLLLSPLQAQDLYFTLLNGDCDGDNEVTLFDFGIVVNAFGSTPNDPNWDPRADLDGDLEVTLFDYGIVVRNFGAVGAEPFDPALPRQPAPSEGYALQGFVELEDWLGSSQPVRIEALREDDPGQIVYWMDVQSSTPFTLHLPRSGLWWVKASGMPHALTAQRSAKKTYSRGDAVRVIVVYPSRDEKFGDDSVDDGPIPIHVHAFDYDDVTYTSADGSVELKNKERELSSRLRAEWEIVSGGGSFVFPNPLGFDAAYKPPALGTNEPSRQVKLRCKIWDENANDPLRRDGNPDRIPPLPAAVAEVEFTLVKDPTIANIHCQAIGDDGSTVSSAPIASGAASADRVRLRFTFSTRQNKTAWELYKVQWQVPWAGTASGDKGEVFTTEPIPSSQNHAFFSVTVVAKFRRLKPGRPPHDPPQEEDYEYREDTKTRTFPLCFAKTDHDEWNDMSRGESFYFDADPPNWFDAKPAHSGHWGHVIDRFNETDSALAGSYIVYYMPDRPANYDDLRRARAVFDWSGKYAPPGHDYEVSYRGRIYLIGAPIIARTDSSPDSSKYGVFAGGIDRVGVTLAHEFAHRDLWLHADNWGGFTPDKIGGPADRGGPGYFFPGTPWAKTGLPTDIFYDKDGDCVRDRYERSAEGKTYHFLAPPDEDIPLQDISPYAFAIERWWTGDQTARERKDVEAHAGLWGEWGKEGTRWNGYKVGSKDTQDWSVGGRQNY